jgi:TolB-like protein
MRFSRKFPILVLLSLVASSAANAAESSEKTTANYPVAILPFRERGQEVKGLGGQACDLLLANLAKEPTIWLVEREDLNKAIGEQELNLAGIVNPESAIKIGHITGAKILVTGSVFQAGNSLYLVAKVMGSETTRVLGASAKGPLNDGVDPLAAQVADDIVKLLQDKSSELVAATVEKGDRIKSLKEKLGTAKRPVVTVNLTEQHFANRNNERHPHRLFDPAAETEMIFFCTETGFQVLDARQGNQSQAKILISGEAISEFATRRGNLISVRARLEVKAVDRASGKVVAIDRQTCIAVDLAEQVAAKAALQEASAAIAERLLPKIMKAN